MSKITKEEIRQMAIQGKDISQLDVSHIEDFSRMFEGILNFNQDISDWDVSNGKYFLDMFRGCKNFNCDISKWDISSGVYFSSMFFMSGVSQQKEILDKIYFAWKLKNKELPPLGELYE